ncbi:serine hydrolase domain-containing protein [uncultured Croceitalea sp.]|uniref:serine hydrolase domain-containing protein n=1 Tax=uncultured Croceitalea sp. TaxID=1798908 RepID=UPI0033068CA4
MSTNSNFRQLFFLVFFFSIIYISCKNNSNSAKPDILAQQNKGVLFEEEVPTILLDSFVHANRDKHKVPAVSLAIIKEGKIIYTKNYGVVNFISQEPVTQKSVFEAASITKPIFAYTVCRLAQKGVIDLDASLHERFPFSKSDIEKYPCYKDITARHVLTHVTGLRNWGVELVHCPGEQYGYSGQGFEYLTKALAKSFTEEMDRTILKYLKEEVLLPFDMNNTYFVESETLKARCVDGHLNHQPTEQEFPESPEMAFGMHCNATDIAKFAIGLGQRTGLSKEMATDMFTLHTRVPESEKEFDGEGDQGYGLGLYLRNSSYGKVFGHSGSNYDFICLFEVYDDLNMGYVIMTNSDTGDKFIDELRQFLIEDYTD